MDHIKWKLFLSALCTFQVVHAQQMQDSISMSSDGWRPIIGSSRRGYTQDLEIQYYRNPIQNSETVKAETPSTTPTPPPPPPTIAPVTVVTTRRPPPSKTTPAKPGPPKDTKNGAVKPNHLTNGVKIIPHHMKNQFFVMSNGAHGPHIPLNPNAHGRPPQINHFKKYPPQMNKYSPGIVNGKRLIKPIRMQAAHSTRDEYYLPAPNGFSQFIQKKNPVKIRQTSDLGIHGAKPFRGSQPIDYTNHFQLGNPGSNVFQSFGGPVQSYVSLKLPQTNEVHYQLQNQNDEYTRNLVPPPTFQSFQDIRRPSPPGNHPRIPGPPGGIPGQSLKQSEYLNQKPESVVQLSFPQQSPQGSVAPPTQPNLHTQDVQITKEQLKVFHNEVPLNYNQRPPQFIDYHSVRTPSNIQKGQTYEVTESVYQQEGQGFPTRFQQPFVIVSTQKPIMKARVPPRMKQPFNIQFNSPPFLPTPYRPETVAPTSPTQNDVSTIYSQLSLMKQYQQQQQLQQQQQQQEQEQQPSVESASALYDIKEVSTHFPIVGKPSFEYETTTEYPDREISNEITINKLNAHAKPVTTTRPVEYISPQTRPPKRKRPTLTTTEEAFTTEAEEVQRVPEYLTEPPAETEPPTRRRKPLRHRTTTPYMVEGQEELPSEKPTRGRYKPRRKRPNHDRKKLYRQRTTTTTTTSTPEPPTNHKLNDDYTYEEMGEMTERYQNPYSHIEASYMVNEEATEMSRETYTMRPKWQYEIPIRPHKTEKLELRDKYEITTVRNLDSIQSASVEDTAGVTEFTRLSGTTKKYYMEDSGQQYEFEITTRIPESYTNPVRETNDQDEEGYVTEIITTPPTTTTTAATTTTTEPSTTRAQRVRQRPIRYNASSRPRFSVKDYRDKLNQYKNSTDIYKTDNARVRFPTRGRRPSTTTSSPLDKQAEESNVDKVRRGFRPKDPRHGAGTEGSNLIITEKNVKPVNTNLRPFGRHRTTESTTPAVRVSIRPNLFARRTRPPHLSLRTRIQNKNNDTENDETKTEGDDATEEPSEVSSSSAVISDRDEKDDTTMIDEIESTTADILKNDPYLYSQRVSDLTSSAKKEYDTPGLFKSVAPTSRRIPSYFTISTEDPILPIEAFFPNIKEKE